MASGSVGSENANNRGYSSCGYIGKKYFRSPAIRPRLAAPANHMNMLVHITRNYRFSICRNNFHRNRKFRWIDVFCHRKYFFIYDQDITDSFWIRIIQIRIFNQKHSGHRI